MFGGLHRHFSKHFGRIWGEEGHAQSHERRDEEDHGLHIQMCRSCTTWSSGKPTEHSIANAYIEVITNAQKFIYIENQVGLCHFLSAPIGPATPHCELFSDS